MRGIVLIDHGSREPSANAQLDMLAEEIATRLPDRVVRAAHMQLAEPTLADAIDALVAAGAREIAIHPFFVAPGRHVREDIPRLVAEAQAKHSSIEIHLTEPLGLHPSVIDAVLDRLDQT
ncbi:MAG: cobalamin biosynthesis protein CbiX [bacterium]|nr:cobalamin biosynthesis protein CbiX [bacterium]MCP5066921.1 cobalamin biosynthesis protein CbiX [bacterium]